LTNRSRQHRRVRLFEIGRSFVQEKDEVKESRNLGGLVFGPIRPLHWSASVRLVDFFDAKGDVEALLSLSAATDVQFHPVRHSALHSAQAAGITLRGRRIGLIGALHPDLVRQLELDQAPILYQLSLEALQFGQVPQHAEISKFPAVHRDLSVLVDEQVTARQVLDLVAQIAGASLEKLELFDVYRGEGIDSKRKSIAFSLTLRSSSRTLIDEEINKIMGRVVVALETKLGAELRA
ncbi:MAG: phenylalanine--tRNA ligase subunit beta, partial [Gammaproteobacteria bacterium]|nr:phenylalanine--tRNA ligase subunit beta [Gammaproteobacteria bacterium]